MRQEELIAQVESRIDELASQIKKVAIQGAAEVRWSFEWRSAPMSSNVA